MALVVVDVAIKHEILYPQVRAVLATRGHLGPSGPVADLCGNVVDVMPHPGFVYEKLTRPTTDGLGFFFSIIKQVINK